MKSKITLIISIDNGNEKEKTVMFEKSDKANFQDIYDLLSTIYERGEEFISEKQKEQVSIDDECWTD